MLKATRDGLTARLRTWFPDREFFVRSNGQVRFVRISSRLQVAAAALVAGIAVAWLTTLAAMLAAQFGLTGQSAALVQREARVASAEQRVSEYRAGVGKLAADLARRQQFLEAAVESHFGELSVEDAAVTAGPAATTRTSGLEATSAGFAAIEARQLAFAERLTALAGARAAAAEQAIRRVGLSPRLMLARVDDKRAQGGPLLALAREGETLDPAFERLGATLARMSALERGLEMLPSHLPARLEFISSGFGYRSDPLTGAPAMHAGLDFRGPVGAPIHAAAAGKVTFAGTRDGYGNCLEIDHGNGMVTRYAHMSAFGARVGQAVEAGAVIGAIGNTGRSTGPHLHFEVRINDRAVNPKPFLEASARVFDASRGAPAARRG